MTKVINTEKFVKGYYTKSEIRYINAQGWAFVLGSMVPAGCIYKKQGWSQNANVCEITITSKDQLAALEKAVGKRVKTLKNKMEGGVADDWCKADDARIAEMKKRAKMVHDIEAMLTADGLFDVQYTINVLRTGTNIGYMTARWDDNNGIVCIEDVERDGYSRSCKFAMVRRSFILKVRRGWHIFRIGGLLTFVKGRKINREGMACEWVEQGKSIADIRTVKGFLVRGEHIEAKSLKEAKAINAEHRAMQLARLLSARKKAERRAEQAANGTLRITLQDSLNAGNCLPGTSMFKHRYEAAIGHEAKDISIADLRKYGKLFGVEYYAERAIKYALNH